MAIIGSVLGRFSRLSLSTADEKQYTLENNFLTRLALRLIGVPHLGFRARARVMLRAASRLPAAGRALDAGCGYGIYSFSLAERGWTVDSIDLETVRIEEIKKMLTEAPDLAARVHPVAGSLATLPFQDQVYDLIVCSEVIEHMPEDVPALNELARVIKPGGTLLLSVPHWSTHNLRIFRSFDHERPGYTEGALRAFLTERGFEIEKVSFYEYRFGTFLFDAYNRFHSKALMGLLFYPFYALYLLDALLTVGEPNGIIVIAKKLPKP
ncbi:MAG TPA: class I SAM-dependent methyltransferase [Candidatus Paceibacterota bacterium]|nr:class I SAM-dependent methyltransferase [Candidatus Paceibacterota bacterium]